MQPGPDVPGEQDERRVRQRTDRYPLQGGQRMRLLADPRMKIEIEVDARRPGA